MNLRRQSRAGIQLRLVEMDKYQLSKLCAFVFNTDV